MDSQIFMNLVNFMSKNLLNKNNLYLQLKSNMDKYDVKQTSLPGLSKMACFSEDKDISTAQIKAINLNIDDIEHKSSETNYIIYIY